MTPEVTVCITVWITVGISIISLVVSIIAIFISWRAYERDRNDLKITAEFILKSGKGTAFKVRLVNIGRRSISIENVSLRLKSGKQIMPKMENHKVDLVENEPHICWFPLFDYKDEINSPLDVKQAEADDSHGKKYSFQFSKLRKQILKEWTTENDWLKKAK